MACARRHVQLNIMLDSLRCHRGSIGFRSNGRGPRSCLRSRYVSGRSLQQPFAGYHLPFGQRVGLRSLLKHRCTNCWSHYEPIAVCAVRIAGLITCTFAEASWPYNCIVDRVAYRVTLPGPSLTCPGNWGSSLASRSLDRLAQGYTTRGDTLGRAIGCFGILR